MRTVIGFDGKRRQLDEGQFLEYKRIKSEYDFWERKQGVRKVLLNSTYGALLNDYFRFSNVNMGQSVTLSGRVVMRHMAKQTNREITGTYAFGDSIIYGDTDSAYFTLQSKFGRDASIDDVVREADQICMRVNESMAREMARSFFIPESRNTISVGREIVGRRGLFKDGKKRYAIAIVDKEGTRAQSMKIMGMDTKRTEIPEFVRRFLKECIEAVVRDGKGERDIRAMAMEFIAKFKQMPPWEIGRLSKVSNLSQGTFKLRRFQAGEIPNPRLHFSVVAAINMNRYIEYHRDGGLEPIRDGDKAIIFDLKKSPSTNPLELDSIALPVGARFIPQWFKDLPFNMDSMVEKLIHRKLEVTFGVLGWSLRPPESAADDVFG